MLEKIPGDEEMLWLLGEEMLAVWQHVRETIEAQYEMEQLWDKGYREWVYEYKYRRGGKTLATLYAKDHCVGVQLIFGKAEREKVEAIRGELLPGTLACYDAATTFHDGKWMMLMPESVEELADLPKLLAVKRRPNRK